MVIRCGTNSGASSFFLLPIRVARKEFVPPFLVLTPTATVNGPPTVEFTQTDFSHREPPACCVAGGHQLLRLFLLWPADPSAPSEIRRGVLLAAPNRCCLQ